MSDENILTEIKADDRVRDVIKKLRNRFFPEFMSVHSKIQEARDEFRETQEIAERASRRAKAALDLKL